MSTWNKAIKPFLACWLCKCEDDIDFDDANDENDDGEVDDVDDENEDDGNEDDDHDVHNDQDVPEDRWGTLWGCPPPFGIAQCPLVSTERNYIITFLAVPFSLDTE